MKRAQLLIASAALAAGISGCATIEGERAAISQPAFSSPEEKLLFEAHRLALQHRLEESIATVDRILAKLGDPEAKADATRSYCARSFEETVYYMGLAQKLGQNAVALGPTWAEAFYVKAYVLIELGRLDEARQALAKALVLSPASSKYLSELGRTWQAERDWSRALDLFRRAEEAARYSPPDSRVEEQTRALRGQGFALVELHRLDEAEAKYRQSLAVDAGDFRSQQELGYVARLRRK